MTEWTFQKAKSRPPESLTKATDEGPQVITLRGDTAVAVIAADEYARLTRKPKDTLIDFFRKSPRGAVVFDIMRNHDTGKK